MVLSGLLFILGAVILFKAFGRPDDEPMGRIAWRGILFILPAPIFFGLTVRGLGFVPALFITTLIASQASVRMRPLPALILGGEVAEDQQAAFANWQKALALPTVQGLVIGRSLLYPPGDDVAVAVDTAVGLL